MNKRGQITGIIIAIVILVILTALFFALSKEPKIDPAYEPDTLPVPNYIRACMQKTTFEGLKILSAHGGYLNTDSLIAGPDIRNSNAISLPGDYLIPFWYYLDSSSLFSSRMPQLEGGRNSIKYQLEQYVNHHILECFNGFEAFSYEFLIEYTEPQTTINFNNKVVIDLIMPTTITHLSNTTVKKINDYHSTLDIDYKKIFDTAKAIVDYQINYNIFENNVLNLIALYSGIDSPLPPMSHYEIGSNKFRYWTKTNVKKIIKNDILDLLRLTQVVNSKGFNPVQTDENLDSDESLIRQGIYNSMHFTLTNFEIFDYSVYFEYPGTPFYLNIADSELITPKNTLPIKNFILDAIGFNIYDYSFDYDMSFPILATISTNPLYNGEGIDFKFAFEGNIKNSVPLKSSMFNISAYEKTNKITGLMFDNPSQFSDKVVTIKTYNALDSTYIPAKIYYNCGAETYLGKTTKEGLSTSLPFCMFSGVLIARSDDYLNGVAYFNYDDPGDAIDLQLWPIQERKITLKTISSKSTTNPSLLYSKAEPLKKDEKAMVVLKRIKDFDEEQDIPLMGLVQYNYEKSDILETVRQSAKDLTDDLDLTDLSRLEFDNNIQLVPGKYTLNGFLFYNGIINLPEKQETYCPCAKILGKCLCSEEKIVYPEQNFTFYPLGNLNLNFTIKPQDLYSSDELNIYIFKEKIPTSWDDLNVEENQLSKLLIPEFKKSP